MDSRTNATSYIIDPIKDFADHYSTFADHYSTLPSIVNNLDLDTSASDNDLYIRYLYESRNESCDCDVINGEKQQVQQHQHEFDTSKSAEDVATLSRITAACDVIQVDKPHQPEIVTQNNAEYVTTLQRDASLRDVTCHMEEPLSTDQRPVVNLQCMKTANNHVTPYNRCLIQRQQDTKVTTKVKEVNSFLVCVLCGGYIINATTIAECLHSFCRSCIVTFLEFSSYCPVCDVIVHNLNPLMGLREDPVLQNLIYKLIPGLFTSEIKRQADFHQKHNSISEASCSANTSSLAQRWDIIADDESISVSLELKNWDGVEASFSTKRHLLLPSQFPVRLLKKFIRAKYSLSLEVQMEIYHSDEILDEHLTLRDIAYIYSWQKRSPLRLYFSVFEIQPTTRQPVRRERTDRFSAPLTISTNSRLSNDVRRDVRRDVINHRQRPAVVALSPIYPLPNNFKDASFDSSDCSSDPTFRPSDVYRRRRRQQRQSRTRKRKQNHASSKRPVGISEIAFYPRYTSTPKDDDFHKRYERFTYTVTEKTNRDIRGSSKRKYRNVERLYGNKSKRLRQTCAHDVYSFEASQCTAVDDAPVTSSAPKKRGRGRPRKYPKVDTDVAMRPQAGAHPQQKRKRGRPPKSKHTATSSLCSYPPVDRSNDYHTREYEHRRTMNRANIGKDAMSAPNLPVSLDIDSVREGTALNSDMTCNYASVNTGTLRSALSCVDDAGQAAPVQEAESNTHAADTVSCAAADLQRQQELEIKREVEEMFPQLRHIIEGRGHGQQLPMHI